MRLMIGAMAVIVVLLVGVISAQAQFDTDGDGLSDAWERAMGTDVNHVDSDADGFDDGLEVYSGYDPLMGGGARMSEYLQTLDTDRDGIPDVREIAFGLDPLADDTDGDGFSDGEELDHAYDPNDAAPTKLNKYIAIDTSAQRLRYSIGSYELGAHPVSTGKARTPTPRGTFLIASKHPRAWSSVAHLWMPWWMNFTGSGARPGLYGIHELPEWPSGKKEGVDHLGVPVSGGCVRLGVGAAKELYEWADVGTRVTIQ